MYKALSLVLALVIGTAATHATEVTVPADPTMLEGTQWWVEDIGGKGVVDNSHTTVEFPEFDRVSGDTGCNRYFGSVELDGSAISAGPLAGTRRACAEALMDQEMRFYQAMSQVVSWVIPGNGLLHLRNEQGETVVRAWRIEEEE